MYCLNIVTTRHVIGKRKQLLRIAEGPYPCGCMPCTTLFPSTGRAIIPSGICGTAIQKETLPKTLTGRPSSFLHLLPLRRMALCPLENYSYFIVGRRIKRRKPFAQDARAREPKSGGQRRRRHAMCTMSRYARKMTESIRRGTTFCCFSFSLFFFFFYPFLSD